METFAVAREREGRNFYLAVRSRGNLQIVEDEEDCHRLDGGKDDDRATRAAELEKESPPPSPPTLHRR